MTAETQPVSMLTAPRSIRALQRAVGGALGYNHGEDQAKLLGPHKDVWAEIITTKSGQQSGRVTLIDPARYGFRAFSTIEIRNVQNPSPRFIGTPAVLCEDTMDPTDIVDPQERRRIANTVAVIVMAGCLKR